MVNTDKKRILIVLTSHADLGGVRPTGFYVSEAAEPWKVFRGAGYEVDLASIAGGVPPQDGRDETDSVQAEFLSNPDVSRQLTATPALINVDPARYAAVFFAGGHGAMWDFPDNPEVARVGSGIWEADGVVAAVCHGPAALVGLTLSDGSALVAGRRLTGFTDGEEHAVGLTGVVPFLLADRLVDQGATHVAAPNFTEHVERDGRLVTGQNPQSAAATARAVVDVLAGV